MSDDSPFVFSVFLDEVLGPPTVPGLSAGLEGLEDVDAAVDEDGELGRGEAGGGVEEVFEDRADGEHGGTVLGVCREGGRGDKGCGCKRIRRM